MNLASEDSLRLGVLFTQQPQAIRIDEANMTVYALTSKGEAKIKLKPSGKDHLYLRRVREMVSSHILGSPGGYPVYIKRWTRMGQARSESLQQLLLLGEPEAVVAVVHAEGLSDELAKRAWWCMPNADNARRMLEKPSVAQGGMGKVLTEYLLEHLPFETESNAMIDTVCLILKNGLIDEQTKLRLWKKAENQSAYYVGFLLACPHNLPVDCQDNPNRQTYAEIIKPLCNGNNPYALLLDRLWQAQGKTYLETVRKVLQKAKDQDVIVRLMQALEQYFMPGRFDLSQADSMEKIHLDCEKAVHNNSSLLAPIIDHDAKLIPSLFALLFYCSLREDIVNPIFSRTDAIGSLMRRKLQTISQPIIDAGRCLMEAC